MKVLLTGANGFIGAYWIEALLQCGARVIATVRDAPRSDLPRLMNVSYRSLDLTDLRAVESLVLAERPDAILHAAALSKPDECALHPELADQINTEATRHLLTVAESVGSYFCYLSTDFVFDGVRGMYTETDSPLPVNHYGLTKWRAEQLVQAYPHAWSIVRTVLVYGRPVPGRPNLLSLVAQRLQAGARYSVVDDQFRTPTYAGDLANGVARLIQGTHSGIFHLSGKDLMTPYDMAIRTALHLGLDPAGIDRVSAATFQQPALRPMRTGLDIRKAQAIIGYQPGTFEEGLRLSFPPGA